MCAGLALAGSEAPRELVGRHGLERRVHERGGESDVCFLYRHRKPLLPIWHDGRLELVRWGNGRGQSRGLPRTGWTWQATSEAGGWSHCEAVPVNILATMGLENGIGYRVRQGMRGLLVSDERGVPVVSMICKPASHYSKLWESSNSSIPGDRSICPEPTHASLLSKRRAFSV